MGAASVIGYGLIGIAPHFVMFFALFLRKHFMLLIFLFSAFTWLVTLLFISVLVRGFIPLNKDAGAYAGVLIFAVSVQEVMRLGFWYGYRRIIREVGQALRDAASSRRAHAQPAALQRALARRKITADDKFHLALSMGYGHGLCHSLFFFLSNLPVARKSGTFYTPMCPSMNYFLASALLTLGMTLIHTYSMPLAVLAWEEDGRRKMPVVVVVLLHYAAALLTLGNFRMNGCHGTIPALISLGVLTMVWALWEQARRRAAEDEQEDKEARAQVGAPLASANGANIQMTAIEHRGAAAAHRHRS